MRESLAAHGSARRGSAREQTSCNAEASAASIALHFPGDPVMADQSSTLVPRILVVDDNEDNRYTLILRLELEGYQDITVAEDGESALKLLRAQDFDLVLLDVMMPKLDGYQVLEHLKADRRFHNVPIIMISAVNEMDSVIRCIGLGAVDYLSKPFDPVLLKARVTASIEKKRLRDEIRAHLARIEEELDSARQLQMSMVPAVFPRPTSERPVEIFAVMEPAREVGGDLYDFFDTPDGTVCFLVGDVSGKGVPSAMFMARTKNLVRLLTRFAQGTSGRTARPAEIMELVNRELCLDNDSMMFVTLFFGMLTPGTGELSYCNAGHAPPYRISGSALEPITGGKGRPLGIRVNSIYRDDRIRLVRGDMVYVYSDGITEATNAGGDLFTEDRLEAILRNAAGAATEQVVKSVNASVKQFVAGTAQSDDITALALRWLGSPSSRPTEVAAICTNAS
jgi:phosphoserine phosphatase RsbU/P